MQIRFLPEADTDLAEARVWYGLQRDGLDIKLMERSMKLYRGSARLREAFR